MRQTLFFDKLPSHYDQHEAEQLAAIHIKKVIEALLFAAQDPLSFKKIEGIVETIYPLSGEKIKEMVASLQEEYLKEERAFQLEETEEGYILRSRPEFTPYIGQLYGKRRDEKLSHQSAEVLAIIAFRQPITRPQIDAIRGVDSSGILHSLIEKKLIEQKGKLEAPGRPTQYGTTPQFLHHFGLKDVRELCLSKGSQNSQ